MSEVTGETTKRASTADLHKLARTMLASPDTSFPPGTRGPVVRRALAECGYGLSHFLGEHVVALVDKSEGGEAFNGFVVTDRSILCRFGDERWVVALATITGVERDEGFLSTTVRVKTKRGDFELPTVTDGERIERFLAAVASSRYVPSVREAPAVVITEADPAGLSQLVESLRTPSRAVAALLGVLWGRLDARALTTDAALDLAVRVQTLHRSLTFGRGLHDGAFVSALRPDDLAALLPELLPARGHTRADGPGFVIEARLASDEADGDEGGSNDPVSLAERLQDKVLAGVVDQVVDRITKRALGEDLATLLGEEATALRVKIAPGPATDSLAQGSGRTASYWDRIRGGLPAIAQQFLGGNHRSDIGTLSTYVVHGQYGRSWKDLASTDPTVLTQLDADLLSAEVRGLLVRMIVGWKPTAKDAAAIDEFELLDKVSPLVGDKELAALGLG